VELVSKAYDGEIAVNTHSIQALRRSQIIPTKTDKSSNDCREKLEQEIPEFATDDT
jgi:hypothetical protein